MYKFSNKDYFDCIFSKYSANVEHLSVCPNFWLYVIFLGIIFHTKLSLQSLFKMCQSYYRNGPELLA